MCTLMAILRVFLKTISHRLGRNVSTKECLDLVERQLCLQLRIDDFHVSAAQLWPVDEEDLWLEGGVVDPPDILPTDSEEEEEEEFFQTCQSIACKGPEKAPL